MRFQRCFLTALACAAGLLAAVYGGWAQSPPPDSGALSLRDAVAIALHDNRDIKNSAIEVSQAADKLAIIGTTRLPSLHVGAQGNQLLTPLDFTFTQGVFGNFPFIGPVPAKNTEIGTPLRPTGIFEGRVTQPLSQLYRIHLEMAGAGLSREAARERLRQRQHDVIESVKESYFKILQKQAALRSANENVNLYRELDRTTSDYVLQNVALRADSLDVKMRLAKAEYDVMLIEDDMATQKQQLNRALGRNPLTQFTVKPIEEPADYETDLAAARSRAMEQRPELRQARLNIEEAEQQRRIRKSEYIPDASLSLQYYSLQNFRDFLPRNIASVGIKVDWEVFDWGRKKHEVDAAALDVEKSQNSLREAETAVVLELESRFRQLQEARQLMRIAQVSHDAASEHLRVIKTRYSQQASLIKDVLQAQSTLEETNRQYQDALSSFWTARAAFERAVGDDE